MALPDTPETNPNALVTVAPPSAVGSRRTAAGRATRSLIRARWPLVALFLIALLVVSAVASPLLAPRDPNRQNLIKRLQAPFERDRNGVVEFVLGTDDLGRDILSRLIFGARVSLLVGFTSVLIGGSLGTALGLIAGFYGGRTDSIIMRIGDIQLAFPFILLAIMFLVVLGPGLTNLVLVLGIGQWVTYARIARGEALSQREREYIEAARALGASDVGIMVRGILPNILAPLIVIASFNVASVILSEAALSFLGLGVPPSVPTWGAMLASSRDQLLAGRWWLAVFPGVAIMLTVLSFNILGDWLRDYLDPRLKGV